jgi:hypothetical protein
VPDKPLTSEQKQALMEARKAYYASVAKAAGLMVAELEAKEAAYHAARKQANSKKSPAKIGA